MTKVSWSSALFGALLVASLPLHAVAYRILMIPFIGKSHVFSLAAMADGLAKRGHQVTFFIGERFPLNIPELRNRSDISVVRFKDATDGVYLDYDDLAERCTQSAIESGGSVKELAVIMKKAYVSFA